MNEPIPNDRRPEIERILRPGDEVRIIAGVFENFPGFVDSCDGETVHVQPAVFGARGPIIVKRSEVELVKSIKGAN